LASDTKFWREVYSRRLSVEPKTALGIALRPAITRSILDCLSSPSMRPASASDISFVSAPSSATRLRHRDRLDGAIAASGWKYVSPA
jgi:hypothetical protein